MFDRCVTGIYFIVRGTTNGDRSQVLLALPRPDGYANEQHPVKPERHPKLLTVEEECRSAPIKDKVVGGGGCVQPLPYNLVS